MSGEALLIMLACMLILIVVAILALTVVIMVKYAYVIIPTFLITGIIDRVFRLFTFQKKTKRRKIKRN